MGDVPTEPGPTRRAGAARSGASLACIVPAHDAEDFIGAAIAHLRGAGLDAADILVVDDGSTDGTARIARAAGARVLRGEARGGAAAARNLGARATDADILLFVDADVCVAPDAISLIRVRLAAEPELAAVFGAYDDDPADPGRISRIRNLLHHWVHLTGQRQASSFWTGLGAVRREAFEAVGGFDPAQDYMEDVAFGHALWREGWPIALDPAIRGKHLKAWSLVEMLRTDLLRRALPWSRLLLAPDGETPPPTLNVGPAAEVSVMSVAASLIGLAIWPFAALGPWICGAALIALACANLGFLRFLAGRRGPGDAVAAVPILWLHYLMAGTGFALALAEIAWARAARTRSGPRVD